MDIKRRCELKEHEFFHLVEEALKTADPVKARLVFEKRKELSDLVREYKANSGLLRCRHDRVELTKMRFRSTGDRYEKHATNLYDYPW
uniref:Uncharacterized protein n=1 Tax=Oryza nivara TaxID=4536 RepID=A0A0E0GTD2_ORYNI